MIWKPGEAMKNTNNAFSVLSQTHSSAPIVLIIASMLAVTAIGVKAQTNPIPISVSDSTMQINLEGGLSGWTAGGMNQLANQSYYYSVGGGVEYPINAISAPSTPTFSG